MTSEAKTASLLDCYQIIDFGNSRRGGEPDALRWCIVRADDPDREPLLARYATARAAEVDGLLSGLIALCDPSLDPEERAELLAACATERTTRYLNLLTGASLVGFRTVGPYRTDLAQGTDDPLAIRVELEAAMSDAEKVASLYTADIAGAPELLVRDRRWVEGYAAGRRVRAAS